MSNTYISLTSLSMDLKRVAMGYYRNSIDMAERFYQESLKRKDEINPKLIPSYLFNLLDEVENLQKLSNNQVKAEQALMLSTLFKNATTALTNNDIK